MTTLAPVAPSSPTATGVTLSIARQSLKTALGKLAAAVDSSSKALPVAQHLKFDLAPGVLTLTATDFNAFVTLRVSCESSGVASVLLPAKRLAEIVAALPPAPVTLVITGTRAVLTAGRSRFELAGLAVEEFPPFPAADSALSATVHAARFLDAIDRAAAHASTEDARPALNVVRLAPADGQLLVIGCEGHHLARLSAGPLTGTTLRPCSIHRTTPALLARLFSGLVDEAALTLTIDEYRLVVASADATASVRLVDLSFPPIDPVIAAVTPTRAILCDRVALAAAVHRVALAASEASRRVVATIADDLTLTAADAKRGTAVDVVSIDDVDAALRGDGTPLTIALNAGWLLTALETLTAQTVRLAFVSPVQPVVVTSATQDATDPTLVLMQPIRLEM